MGMTIAQSIFQEGRLEGEKEGALRHARAMLLRLGARRFGAADELTRRDIENIADNDRLDRMTDRIGEFSSWRELLDSE